MKQLETFLFRNVLNNLISKEKATIKINATYERKLQSLLGHWHTTLAHNNSTHHWYTTLAHNNGTQPQRAHQALGILATSQSLAWHGHLDSVWKDFHIYF